MTSTLKALAATMACLCGCAGTAEERPPVKYASLFAIAPALAQAQAIAKDAGERLWPGYGSAPFGFLLIDDGVEWLICQPGSPAGFRYNGMDSATGCPLLTRPRSTLPENLLAAMPVLGTPATIVMGSPAATGRSEADWKRTILHEHFHQWQTSLPNYYARVEALNLADGDRTGMWMLDYPFPYTDPDAGQAYRNASLALADALDRRGRLDFPQSFDRYLAARRAFAATVTPRDWDYLEFQLWQEGTARWTEIELGKRHPDEQVRAGALILQNKTLAELGTPDLAQHRRLAVYSLGAGEAMLMEACGSHWRKAYRNILAHGALLMEARKACHLDHE